jgi:hypothetical protein
MTKTSNSPSSQGRQLRRKKLRWTTEMMIYAIDLWHRQHLRAPTIEDWIPAGENHPRRTTLQRRVGSWNRALSAAGLDDDRALAREVESASRIGVAETPSSSAFCSMT